MKVEITRNVMIAGEPVSAGSICDLEISVAQLLIGLGKAALAVEPEPEANPEPVAAAAVEPDKAAHKRGRHTAPATGTDK